MDHSEFIHPEFTAVYGHNLGRCLQVFPCKDRISYARTVVEVQGWLDSSIHIYHSGEDLKIKGILHKKKIVKKINPECELELLKKESKEMYHQFLKTRGGEVITLY